MRMKKIWVSCDETTDLTKRYVAINLLWGDENEGKTRENVTLFLADAAPYMVKAGRGRR